MATSPASRSSSSTSARSNRESGHPLAEHDPVRHEGARGDVSRGIECQDQHGRSPRAAFPWPRVCGDASLVGADMLQQQGDCGRWESSMSCFRPFDERNRTVEVRLDIAPLRVAQPVEPVEVEMCDDRCPVVEVADRERRARHGLVDAERRDRRHARASSCPHRDRRAGGRCRPARAGRRARLRMPRSRPPIASFARSRVRRARAGSSRRRRRTPRRPRRRLDRTARSTARRQPPRPRRAGSRAKSSSSALQHRRRVERCGGVVEREEHDGRAAERHLVLLPVNAGDPVRTPGEELRGEVAERRDDARPDELDLTEEMGLAGARSPTRAGRDSAAADT